jgi:hypothetical protein
VLDLDKRDAQVVADTPDADKVAGFAARVHPESHEAAIAP